MRYVWMVSLPLLLLDQLTKWLILQNIPFEGQIAVIPGLFNLVYVANTGAAFSMFQNNNLAFIGLAILALLVVFIFLWRDGRPGRSGTPLSPLTKVALSLLIAGISGNLIDRILRGQVTDFLDFYLGPHHWPSFNVADSCICVAAGLLILGSFRTPAKNPAR